MAYVWFLNGRRGLKEVEEAFLNALQHLTYPTKNQSIHCHKIAEVNEISAIM